MYSTKCVFVRRKFGFVFFPSVSQKDQWLQQHRLRAPTAVLGGVSPCVHTIKEHTWGSSELVIQVPYGGVSDIKGNMWVGQGGTSFMFLKSHGGEMTFYGTYDLL